MRISIPVLAIVLASLNAISAFSQTLSEATSATDKSVKATNFSVPSSAAFNLLEINPSQVHRPGFARDFKFDWLVKDNNLVSNIAIEAQPLWLFFYKNTDYQELKDQNLFQRSLSSLSLSVGTASKDSLRSIAWGAKINLYAAKNPIYDTDYINMIGNFFTNSAVENEFLRLRVAYDLEPDQRKKDSLLREVNLLRAAYIEDSLQHFRAIDKYKEQWEKDNWNSTIIDLGYGRIYNYLSESIDSLSFDNQGGGVWISGNFGIGKKVLINGMVKYSKIAKNNVTTIGANFRYGGLNTNFFVEGLYNAASNDNLERFTIAYGGDIKFKTFALQFGLRTDYNKEFSFKNLIPVVNFNYLLNQ